MKLRASIGSATLAVCLSLGLGFFGVPVASLYADEPQDAASSDAASSSTLTPEVPAAADEPQPQDAASEPDHNAGSEPSADAPAQDPDSQTDSSADQPSSASSESEKKDDASEADDDKDKGEEQDDAEKKKKAKEEAAKKAEAAFEKIKAEAASATAQLNGLPALQGELAPYPEQLAAAWGRLQEVEAQRAPFFEERQGYLAEQEALRVERDTIIANRETADERRAKALYGLILVDEELAKTGGVDLLSVILGTSNATEAESYGYLLEKVAGCIADRVATAKEDQDAEGQRIDDVNVRIAAVSDQVASVDQRLQDTEEERKALLSEVADIVERGNAVAFAIERICSESRQGTQDATNKVLELSGVDTTPNTTSAKAAKAAEQAAQEAAKAAEQAAQEAAKAAQDSAASSGASSADSSSAEDEKDEIPENVAAFVEEAKEWDVKDNPLRVSAQESAGVWYDAVDALAGAEGYISYGMGLDFALDEDAFVEKWAAAINDFYATRGNPPLGGWGEDIARQAYAYHIDPRLCAAVSINESGGGAICIRPHNAWGWGAADSDPYNLASEWSSWPVAIESWHRGMATNPYGLATSPSVSKLSDIYCGTPIWAQRAVDSMELIYEIAKAQQLSQEKESMAVAAALEKATAKPNDSE